MKLVVEGEKEAMKSSFFYFFFPFFFSVEVKSVVKNGEMRPFTWLFCGDIIAVKVACRVKFMAAGKFHLFGETSNQTKLY